jgi:hypothetical protein
MLLGILAFTIKCKLNAIISVFEIRQPATTAEVSCNPTFYSLLEAFLITLYWRMGSYITRVIYKQSEENIIAYTSQLADIENHLPDSIVRIIA